MANGAIPKGRSTYSPKSVVFIEKLLMSIRTLGVR